MDINTSTFQEFKAYWELSEELIANASKDDLAEAIRIFAMQSAQYARKYGELELPDMEHLLSAPDSDDDSLGLLRDGAVALVGVLGSVMIGELDDDSTRSVH